MLYSIPLPPYTTDTPMQAVKHCKEMQLAVILPRMTTSTCFESRGFWLCVPAFSVCSASVLLWNQNQITVSCNSTFQGEIQIKRISQSIPTAVPPYCQNLSCSALKKETRWNSNSVLRTAELWIFPKRDSSTSQFA